MLVLVPVGVTLLVMRWLFAWGTSLLRPTVKYAESRLERLHWIESLPDAYVNFYVYLLTVLLLLLLLYLIGVLGQHIVGRRLIGAGEGIWLRVPLIRTIYGGDKAGCGGPVPAAGDRVQVRCRSGLPLSGSQGHRFFNGATCWMMPGAGFAKVLIPTAPNPTTGFLELVPAEAVVITDLAIEEGFKMIVSCGIVLPGEPAQPLRRPKA